MDLNKLTIGQMAGLNRISTQTLRLYDREGLLTPMITDPDTGYRYYHITQSARLDMIQYMKDYGMTLKQIRQTLDSGDPEAIKAFINKQMGAIDRQMEMLAQRKRAMNKVLENYRKYETLPKDEQVFMEYIPERYIYSYTTDTDYFNQDHVGYEYMLRELKIHLSEEDLNMSYFCNVGTIMREEALISGDFFSNEVFLFVSPDEKHMKPEMLPASMYCCICSDDFYAETDNARKMLDYIDEHGLIICGDYLCEVLVEFPVFQDGPRNMFYKLEIPVATKKTIGNSEHLSQGILSGSVSMEK